MLGQTDITQVGMLLGAVATLGTVIGVLWKQMLSHFKGIDEKLDKTQEALTDCQNDRLQIWQAIAKQAGCQVDDLKQDSQP
tara:strand:- start:668 stop:910 length:243 start_codon:yes stop_codon:yes gene_type:complete